MTLLITAAQWPLEEFKRYSIPHAVSRIISRNDVFMVHADDRAEARTEALESMLGRLVEALHIKGMLDEASLGDVLEMPVQIVRGDDDEEAT